MTITFVFLSGVALLGILLSVPGADNDRGLAEIRNAIRGEAESLIDSANADLRHGDAGWLNASGDAWIAVSNEGLTNLPADRLWLSPILTGATESGGTVIVRDATGPDGGLSYIVAAGKHQPSGTVIAAFRDIRPMMAANDRSVQAMRRMAVVIWALSLTVFTGIAWSVSRSVRRIAQGVNSSLERDERFDALMRVEHRGDELGRIAQAILHRERRHEARLQDLERARAVVESNAGLLNGVLQSMIEGVIAVDSEERIVFRNHAADTILGISNEESGPRRVFEVIRNPQAQACIQESTKHQKTQTKEFRLPRGNMMISMVVTPITGGDSTGAVIVLHDVTELRRLESMRRDFVSGVSHELKTPLTVIQACTETLLDGALDDAEAARRFVLRIEEQSDRLLQLILGMLQLARLQSDNKVLSDLQPVCMRELADRVVRSFLPVAEGKQIEVAVVGADELFVLADPRGLETVVSNLVDNAIKYTPEGGQVSVECREEPEENLLTVKDSGAGIAPEHQDRVFERFYRIDRDRSRERGGTGLGLSIVKHLCNAMGAAIRLRSELGHGCQFTVAFPIAADAPEDDGEFGDH